MWMTANSLYIHFNFIYFFKEKETNKFKYHDVHQNPIYVQFAWHIRHVNDWFILFFVGIQFTLIFTKDDSYNNVPTPSSQKYSCMSAIPVGRIHFCFQSLTCWTTSFKLNSPAHIYFFFQCVFTDAKMKFTIFLDHCILW